MGEDCPDPGIAKQISIANVMQELSKEWGVPHAVLYDAPETKEGGPLFDGYGNVPPAMLTAWLGQFLPYMLDKMGYPVVAAHVLAAAEPAIKDLEMRGKAWLS